MSYFDVFCYCLKKKKFFVIPFVIALLCFFLAWIMAPIFKTEIRLKIEASSDSSPMTALSTAYKSLSGSGASGLSGAETAARRLAAFALHNDYGREDVKPWSPKPTGAVCESGNLVAVEFVCAEGLAVRRPGGGQGLFPSSFPCGGTGKGNPAKDEDGILQRADEGAVGAFSRQRRIPGSCDPPVLPPGFPDPRFDF